MTRLKMSPRSRRITLDMRGLVYLTLLLLAYRLAVIQVNEIGLFFDEAYYFFWSLIPDWGYFSKPPMVAWLIAGTTTLLPVSDLTVKLASPLLFTATTLLVAAMASRLFDRQTGVWAGLLFLTMPLVSFNSLFITTDAPLLFFWALTTYCFIRALESDALVWWLAAGITGGLGLLSKYTMILLPLSILLFLISSSGHRHLLFSARLWIGFLLAAAVYSPNLVWNADHDFISFEHTKEISQLAGPLFHPLRLLEFLGGQFALFGLVNMGILIGLLFRPGSYRDERLLLLLASVIPLLGAISVQALLARANVNWAAPVYVPATIACAYWLVKNDARKWFTLALFLNIAFMSLLYHYHAWLSASGIEASSRTDPYQRILGWQELGDQLSPWRQHYPDATLLSGDRDLLSYLGYYTEPRFDLQVASWNPEGDIDNHFDLMADITLQPDGKFLYVSRTRPPVAWLRAFRFSLPLDELTVDVYEDLQRRVFVYYLEDFGGYESIE